MNIPRRFLQTILALLLLTGNIVPAAAQETVPQDSSAAVIFAYQSIGDTEYQAGSITADKFQDHINELMKGDYNFISLPDLVDALKQGKTLPPYTVALTFDGTYRTVLESGIPLLLKNNIPFTVFVSTDYPDRNDMEYMSWGDLKKLSHQKLVTLGLHPASYIRLSSARDEDIRLQLNKARACLRETLGVEATLFSYPFGEMNNRYKAIVADSGFEAAFGQQSGVAYSGTDLYNIPRFTMTENYGDLDRFRLVARALPLPAADIEPRDTILSPENPAIGFTVDGALAGGIKKMSCFLSGQGKIDFETIGKSRIEMRIRENSEDTRPRINCTMPATVPGGDPQDQRWRWLGFLFSTPGAQNQDGQPDSDIDRDPDQKNITSD